MDRVILHCDMNNFYASVESLYRPELKNAAVAVCGDSQLRHGIVLAKNEKAKACGVKTGEAIWQAKEKCPDLVVIEPHFQRYVKYSRLAREIYCEYTDLVEPFGMDECWLDVSASRLAFGDGKKIADTLRERMKKELGLTISVGVSFNKIFAKLGSDLKKPDGTTVISREGFREQIGVLPVEDLMGVGRKNQAVLNRFGILTIKDLAAADDRLLEERFGKIGAFLKSAANGEDPSPVLPHDLYVPMKSVGHGLTTKEDLKTPEEVWLLILSLCQDIGEKLRFHQMTAEGVAIDCKTNTFCTRSLQKKMPIPTDCTMTLAKEAFSLFRERYPFREPLRSVTVRAIQLADAKNGMQLSLFEDKGEFRNQKLDQATDAIRRRWGKTALQNASLLNRNDDSEESDYVPFHAT